MRAAVVEALNQPLVVRDVPDPEWPPDGAIVRVSANGICRTDWHLWSDDWRWRGLAIAPPFVLGHEFGGVIEEVGREVRSWKLGDRVIFPMNPGTIFETLSAGAPKVPDAALELLTPQLRAFSEQTWSAMQSTPFAKTNADLLPNLVRMQQRFVRKGGMLMAGTDPTGFGGVIPGFSARRQLELMVRGGFPFPQALQICTLNGARLLGRDSDVGSVEVGKRPDAVDRR
jgi:hypothetical protein